MPIEYQRTFLLMRELEDQQIGALLPPHRAQGTGREVNLNLDLKIDPLCAPLARTEDFKTALQDLVASSVVQLDRNPEPPTVSNSASASSSAAPSPAASTSTSLSTIADGSRGSRVAAAVSRDRMLKVAEFATAAVRAGEDKVGLAITLYEAVRSALGPIATQPPSPRGSE